MPLSFTCPACAKPLEAPDAAAGQTGNCKFCRARIVAPKTVGGNATLAQAPSAPAAVAVAAPPASHRAGASGAFHEPPEAGPEIAPPSPPPADAMYPGMVDPFGPQAGYKPLPKSTYLEYGDMWKRVRAHAVDNLILYALTNVLTFATMGTIVSRADIAMGEVPRSVILLFLGLEWAYYAILEASPMQATFGKMWQGLIVTDTKGERLSFGRSAVRSAAKWVSQCTFLIGYLMAMFNEKSQALHDLIAGSCVLEG